MKKPSKLSENQSILRAAEKGNYNALKMLSINDSKQYSSFFQESQPNMKKVETFYLKESFPSKVKFNSQLWLFFTSITIIDNNYI